MLGGAEVMEPEQRVIAGALKHYVVKFRQGATITVDSPSPVFALQYAISKLVVDEVRE